MSIDMHKHVLKDYTLVNVKGCDLILHKYTRLRHFVYKCKAARTHYCGKSDCKLSMSVSYTDQCEYMMCSTRTCSWLIICCHMHISSSLA